jgi:hypothetical protein
VVNGSCELHPDVQQLTRLCFSDYSLENEEKGAFGVHGDDTRNATIKDIKATSESAWGYQARRSRISII